MADSLEREIQGLRALLHTDRDPEGRAFVPLADAYRRARDLDRALEVVSIGLERHPALASAYVVEAWVHQDRGDSNGAAAAWERVLELDAENVEALRGLGVLLAAAGRTARAAPLLEKARALDPEQPEVRGLVAQLEAARGKAAAAIPPAEPSALPTAAAPPEAADQTEGEPEEPPHELPATRTLAELYARQGLHERAAQVYERLVKDHPHDPGLRQRLAELSAAGAPSPATHGVHDEDTEVIARAMSAPPVTAEPPVTLAWGADEAVSEPPPVARHTIASYFRLILDWPSAPRAVPLAEAPEVETAAVELVEAGVVIGAALPAAPSTPRPAEAPAVQRVVPIESLAPGKVVPISALAPDAVPVMTLAPEAVPIEELAPPFGPAASTSRS